MAISSGKTRTVMAFKAHLPDATTVNRVSEKITDGRVDVSTYPTMMNLINDTHWGIRKFGPGYFDLVVIDEAHRSVYQEISVHLRLVRLITGRAHRHPKDEVDHNTYRLFQLEDGVPTRKLRGLLRFLEKAKKVVVYTDFQDELGESTLVALPGITPGTPPGFRLKAAAYRKQHQDHIAVQRLRRNRPLTPEDLTSLEKMLIDNGTGDADDIALAKEQSHGLGLFIRELAGLDREAAVE